MLRKLPLIVKMLALTAIVGVAIWAVLDYVQTKELRKLFQGQLAERLGQQAEEDRIRFDRYVKSHHKSVKLMVGQKRLADYLASQKWFNGEATEIKYYRRPPHWLPRASIMRDLVQPRYAILLDSMGNTREVFQSQLRRPPETLLHPGALKLRLSRNQAYLTTIDDTPYILASEIIFDGKETPRGTLLLASPIDDQLLSASQAAAGGSNLVALLSAEKNPGILVSNNPRLLPAGAPLDSLMAHYLMTGQAFFDYGDSDLVIKFASFISTAEVEMLTGAVLSKERQQRAMTAAALIVSFGVLIFWIIRRIQRLTQKVTDFSTKMKLPQPTLRKGDQLHVLEERFHSLMEEVTIETEALAHQALHDPLTDLPNRTLLQDHLKLAILQGQRDGKSLSLLVMDLDRFKDINDTLGHYVGDLLLQQVSRRLSGLLRRSDTIARLGGDEFGILLPDTDANQAILVARKIMVSLEDPFFIEGHSLNVGISTGIVQYPVHGEDANILVQRADVAMYVAKRLNKGLTVYDPEKDRHSPGRLTLMSELREAIEQNVLMLYYQPRLHIASKQVDSVEALLRWRHPKHGFISPAEFIPMAEQTGVIRQLDQWVVNEALRQCSAWRKSGFDINVAINLSVRSLHDIELPKQLAAMIDTWGMRPADITLEITESAIMDDPKQVREILERFERMGIYISIDDFGTGYSSLAYLKQLPVDEIKIDKSFVIDMTTDENDAVIVRATIDLAHNLNLRVVAEGVEDQESWDLLEILGCDFLQGYALSRPLPAADFLEWLNASGYSHTGSTTDKDTPAPVIKGDFGARTN